MPTILRDGPYRFFFYSGDREEPFHVHIERDDKIAKVWLDPIWLYSSGGFSRWRYQGSLRSLKVNVKL